MRDHTLIFHIGMCKTGTSSLQRFLYDNNHILHKYGWAYPDIYDDGHLLYCNGSKLFMYREDSKRWDIIKKVLQNYNVIISSEDYFSNIPELLEDLSCAKKFCDDVKVVVYLRRQDRAVESMYNQKVKGRSEHGSVVEYMNNRLPWPINYLDALEKINKKIGQENIIVRIYEKEQLKGYRNDTISDFIYNLPIKFDIMNWDEFIFSNNENISIINDDYFEIKKICNSVYDTHDQRFWNEVQKREFVKISNQDHCYFSSGLSTGYFTKQERKNLLESQAQNNSIIAKKYLNRTDGKLFYDDFLDYPVFEDQASDFEKGIIRTLYFIICIQQRKLEMASAIAAVGILRKNRKLAFWGWGDNGKRLYEADLLPDVIIDNDSEKHHQSFMGISIIPSVEIDNWKGYFTIVTPTNTQAIESILLKMNLEKGEDYILLNDFSKLS